MKKLLLVSMFLTLSAAAVLAAPTITSVTPSTITQSYIGIMTVEGTGFVDGAWAYIGDGITDALTASSSMDATYVSSTKLEVYIRAASSAQTIAHSLEVTNPDATSDILASAITVTTIPAGGPSVPRVYFNGDQYVSGQEISPRPIISGSIEAAAGFDLATVDLKILFNNRVIYDNLASAVSLEASGNSGMFSYVPSSDLPGTGINNIYINVKDSTGVPGEFQATNLLVRPAAASGAVKVIGRVLPSQNPCVPTPANPVELQFELDGPGPVTIAIMNQNHVALTRDIIGQTGINRFYWDGSDDLSSMAGNGLYVVNIIVNGQVVGKGMVGINR